MNNLQFINKALNDYYDALTLISESTRYSSTFIAIVPTHLSQEIKEMIIEGHDGGYEYDGMLEVHDVFNKDKYYPFALLEKESYYDNLIALDKKLELFYQENEEEKLYEYILDFISNHFNFIRKDNGEIVSYIRGTEPDFVAMDERTTQVIKDSKPAISTSVLSSKHLIMNGKIHNNEGINYTDCKEDIEKFLKNEECSRGPVTTLPGSVSKGLWESCDKHPKVHANYRLQGETDALGAEYHYLCEECYQEHLKESEKQKDDLLECDHCGCMKSDVRAVRDPDEGTAGKVYWVCEECVDKFIEGNKPW